MDVKFDFTWFERIYQCLVEFAKQVNDVFFVWSFYDYWSEMAKNAPFQPLNTVYEWIANSLPENIANVPIGFGLLFGAIASFVLYTIVKWVLDIVL